MANKTLFQSIVGRLIPATDTLNDELAPAYAFTPEHALAQYAATGCLNTTFYASASDQLSKVVELARQVESERIAKTAVFCRERGFMKDVPALLCAVLTIRDPELLQRIFHRVVDNGKMLRTFVQILRSGAVGRKSLGTAPKRLVRDWLDAHDDAAVFRASVGNDPSLVDVIRMVHPKPRTDSREALYGYLLGKAHDATLLPDIAHEFERFKAGEAVPVPDVPFQMLTGMPLTRDSWCSIAAHGSWQTVRMNLNTFARHGVFEVPGMAQLVAAKLKDERAIAKARVFPYQLLAASLSASDEVPRVVREALTDAMEIAIANVPRIEGKVYICPDVSGSMQSAVTGYRKGATTVVRCVDVAALVAAAILRRNPTAEVIPFNTEVVRVQLEARDTVSTNAAKLASAGGGTATSAPLAWLNQRKAEGDLVVFVSDNESWADHRPGRGTAMLKEWNAFRARNPKARLACIDVQPSATTQVKEREDVLNIGGFSDQVFEVLSEFAAGRLAESHWIAVIDAVRL